MLSLRFITKHFYPNYDKIRVMNGVLDSYIKHKLPETLKTTISDFSWMEALKADELINLQGDWKMSISAALPGQSRINDAAAVQRILQDTSNNKKMWDELQQIKYSYQSIAAVNKAGFIQRLKQKIQAIGNFFNNTTDSILQQGTTIGSDGRRTISKTQEAAMYIAYLDEYARTYDRANATGAENELQRDVLLKHGLYRCVQYAYQAGNSLAKIITSGGAGFFEVKKLVVKVASLINTSGGLISGMSDWLQGKEANYQTLSARWGLDKDMSEFQVFAEKKIRNAVGMKYEQDMRFDVSVDMNSPSLQGEGRFKDIARQNLMDQDKALDRQTPREMQLQTERMRTEIEKDRNELRHSLFWVQVLKRDLVEMREDLAKNDPSNPRNLLMHELTAKLAFLANEESKESSAVDVSQKLRELGTVALMEMNETVNYLTPEIEKFENRLKGFEDLLTQALRKMDTLQTGADTRQDITDTQRRLASLGIAHNLPQLIAREAAAKVALRPMSTTPESSSIPIKDEKSFLADRLALIRAQIADDDFDEEDEEFVF